MSPVFENKSFKKLDLVQVILLPQSQLYVYTFLFLYLEEGLVTLQALGN